MGMKWFIQNSKYLFATCVKSAIAEKRERAGDFIYRKG